MMFILAEVFRPSLAVPWDFYNTTQCTLSLQHPRIIMGMGVGFEPGTSAALPMGQNSIQIIYCNDGYCSFRESKKQFKSALKEVWITVQYSCSC